jgi:hypothetical protein
MPEIPEPVLPDPSLSGGLGNAPTVPPNLSPSLSSPPPNIGGGLPPMGGGGGIGGGGIGALGAGGFGGGAGGGVGGGAGGTAGKATMPVGLRNPGVAPPGIAPAVAGLPTPGGAGAAGAGAIPPMMPPMGGMGAGGAGGGIPGPGNAQRAVTGKGKRRNDGRTPGMPAALGGRAATYREPDRQEPQVQDIPTGTVIDEDLWQVTETRQPHLGY